MKHLKKLLFLIICSCINLELQTMQPRMINRLTTPASTLLAARHIATIPHTPFNQQHANDHEEQSWKSWFKSNLKFTKKRLAMATAIGMSSYAYTQFDTINKIQKATDILVAAIENNDLEAINTYVQQSDIFYNYELADHPIFGEYWQEMYATVIKQIKKTKNYKALETIIDHALRLKKDVFFNLYFDDFARDLSFIQLASTKYKHLFGNDQITYLFKYKYTDDEFEATDVSLYSFLQHIKTIVEHIPLNMNNTELLFAYIYNCFEEHSDAKTFTIEPNKEFKDQAIFQKDTIKPIIELLDITINKNISFTLDPQKYIILAYKAAAFYLSLYLYTYYPSNEIMKKNIITIINDINKTHRFFRDISLENFITIKTFAYQLLLEKEHNQQQNQEFAELTKFIKQQAVFDDTALSFYLLLSNSDYKLKLCKNIASKNDFAMYQLTKSTNINKEDLFSIFDYFLANDSYLCTTKKTPTPLLHLLYKSDEKTWQEFLARKITTEQDCKNFIERHVYNYKNFDPRVTNESALAQLLTIPGFKSAIIDLLGKYSELQTIEEIDSSFNLQDYIKESSLQKITNAHDLSLEQKELLHSAYAQLNLDNTNRLLEQLSTHPVLDLPNTILEKYLPITQFKNIIDTYEQNREEKQQALQDYQEKESDYIMHTTGEMMPFPTQTTYTPKQNFAFNEFGLTKQIAHKILHEYKDTIDIKSFFLSPKNAQKLDNAYYKAGYIGSLLQSQILSQIKKTEETLQQQGYVPFYSGRRWEWNFINDIWNIISALKNNIDTLEDKTSLRFREDNVDTKQLEQYRRELIKNGAAYHIGTGTNKYEKESEVTFMNRTVVSNSNYYGECTATYFLDNHSIAKKGAAFTLIKTLFSEHGLEKQYEIYQDQIEELYKKHEQSSDYGELLCIAIKKPYVDQMVYTAESGGYKKGYFKPSQLLESCSKRLIEDQDFIDAEQQFYCFAVSDIPGEYGDKYIIKSLNLADHEKYAQYQQSKQQLFEQMKSMS